jgi:hypothetical protein
MKHAQSAAAVALFLVFVAASPLVGSAGPKDKNAEKAMRSIRPAEGYEFVKTLASPEFNGRQSGDAGATASCKWAAGLFREWGLKTVDGEGGLLPFPSPYTIVDSAEMTISLPGTPEGGPGIKLQPEKEYLPLLSSDSGDRTGGLVFAGWGISAPELNYDDYAGLFVKGKYVLCFRGTPDRTERGFQVHDEHRKRMLTAADKGALGIIYIYPEIISNNNVDWIPGFLPAVITEKVADRLFEEKGTTAAEVQKALATYKRPISFPLGAKVRHTVTSRNFSEGVGFNVVGAVMGSDPALRKECVIVGAHFDSTGKHMGLLFPGADDNASGSAAVLQIAKALAQLDRKPKRTVLFVLFGGEEAGLRGSYWFAEHLPKAVGKVDAMFNFDMVGEGDGVRASTSAEPAKLAEFLKEADASVGILRNTGTIRDIGVRSSDYAPFFLMGAACMSFGSNGPHLAYHLSGESIYRINPDIIADTARLAFLTIHAWADR